MSAGRTPTRSWRGKSRTRRTEPVRHPSAGELPEGVVRIWGVHPVEAALANPERRIRRLLATENAAQRLAAAIAARGIAVEPASPRDLDRVLGADTVHQGLMLETDELAGPTIEAVVAEVRAGKPLVILDHVTDPHNVGAILRSAAVFGASGVMMTRRHSPPLNGTLAKSASGALELVPVLLVQNLAKAMQELRANGVRLLGLDGAAEAPIEDDPMTEPLALVLGAEGKGLRQLTAESCHRLVRIGASGPLASLNVSNAAAVALHLAAMRRGK